MQREVRRALLEVTRDGGGSVVVFDVDEHRRFVQESGAPAFEEVRAQLAKTFGKMVTSVGGSIHQPGPDRFLLVVPGIRYEDAVALAEDGVARVRASSIPFSFAPSGRLSVTAAVVPIRDAVDVSRADALVDQLLRDGKMRGGDEAWWVREP